MINEVKRNFVWFYKKPQKNQKINKTTQTHSPKKTHQCIFLFGNKKPKKKNLFARSDDISN
jgi:hypothetical protein